MTDVVTPGVGTHDNLLSQKENNYLASIFLSSGDRAATSFLDLSTGDFSLLLEVLCYGRFFGTFTSHLINQFGIIGLDPEELLTQL